MLSRLALLGPVRLIVPHRAVRRASQQRRIALLAVVASSPSGVISRDRVLGLLWPDRDERTARHLLADSLYVLRQTLGDRALAATADSLRINPRLLWTDVAEFHAAVAEDRWADAVHLYRGDFLDDFYLRGAAEFGQWADAERARLRRLATRAASSLARSLERGGNMPDAVVAAERALELAPNDEAVFRDLIRLLMATENRARAAAVGRTFVERLAADLGASPSDRTMRVVRDVRALASAEPIVVFAPPATVKRRSRRIDSVTASIVAQGRHQWHRRTPSAVARAIHYFTQAAEREPRAIDGWCGLADAWVVMGGRGYVPVAEALERATSSARRALANDDASSAAHTSIGGAHILGRDWQSAEAALRRAIAIDPRNADAHHWLALVLLTGIGQADEALREQTIAARLNPVAAIQVGALGWHRYLRREYELSRSDMEPALDLNPEFEEGHAGLARAACRLGDEATVVTTISDGIGRCRDLRGDLLAEAACAFAVLGDKSRGSSLALEAESSGASPFHLGLAWATLAEPDRAFEYLDRASFRVYWAPHAVWWDPRLDSIRDDRRFARVRSRVQREWAPAWR